MTVRDWLIDHTRHAPASLVDAILSALGSDAGAPDHRAGELCMVAAARALDAVLARQAFDRAHALDLLAIDALATLAFEHASDTLASDDAILDAASRAARTLGQLTVARV